ncbi:MAG: SDR family NAD(P)-dependent oxidoreductase [Candidatus Eremiobacterota bacterium]
MSGSVFITGASAGIGAACARGFAAIGRDLILVARRADRLKALQAELAQRVQVRVFALDVTDRAAVDGLIERERAVFDQVEILVNNAGLALGREPLQEGRPEDWFKMIDLNVNAFLYILHRTLPGLLRRGQGHVINLGSAAGHWVYPNGNVYAATKFAVRALSEGLRMDLHGKNIRVTCISPGMVETEFSLVRFGDPDKASAVYRGFTPLTAEDVADAVLWAASRPPHVNVQDIVLFPTSQSRIDSVHRIAT